MCVSMDTHVPWYMYCDWQTTFRGLFSPSTVGSGNQSHCYLLSHLAAQAYALRQEPTKLGVHLFTLEGYPRSPRDPPVSTLPVLGFTDSRQHPQLVMWVLQIHLRPSCLPDMRFPRSTLRSSGLGKWTNHCSNSIIHTFLRHIDGARCCLWNKEQEDSPCSQSPSWRRGSPQSPSK